ncbi:MAG TPA: M48 family metallopeptidase [Bryobacteraceae bacterium]|jgi:predicted Zn-dependent protease|nr:M48 family metallopeptidase [Bryobacteraceae bacterium]
MRRLLGLAVIAGLSLITSSVPSSAADTKSTDQPSKDDEKKPEKDKKKKDKKKDPDEIGNRDVAKGANFYSLEKEIALGKQLAQQVERESKVIDDPIVAEYVNRVGQNIVRNSDCKVPFTIKVVEDESINAFALPGGFFFVNTGLILRADNEAELAGVMAHETAHVCARHGTRQATKAELANYMTIPLIFMGGWAGYGIQQAAGFLVPMSLLKFSRSYESEADMLGLQYMYKTGYDPGSFVDFFEKIQALEKKKHGSVAQLFSSHPMTDDRIEAAQKNIQDNLEARPEYVVNTSEFNDVRARLAMIENRRKVDDKGDPNKPQLRKKPGSGTSDDKDSKGDEDERPTLKRR